MKPRVRIVVIEDSPFLCQLMKTYLTSEDTDVVATAHNGHDGIAAVARYLPDVITLDLEMPVMNGIDTLQRIMEAHPTPVVVVSGVSRKAAAAVQQAFLLGAVDFVHKYHPGQDSHPEAIRREICAKVRSAARQRRPARTASPLTPTPTPSAPGMVATGVVVIGASTGGVEATQRLLSVLTPEFAAGIIVVQHVPSDFVDVVTSQLAARSRLPVRIAREGDRIEAGRVLVAPGGAHLTFHPDRRIHLDRSGEVLGHRPSIDMAMQSAAAVWGRRTTGVVLTGMGNDGTEGLSAIAAAGGATLAQEPSTCVVPGMPQRAIDRAVVRHTGAPEALGVWLKIDQAGATRTPSPGGSPREGTFSHVIG